MATLRVAITRVPHDALRVHDQRVRVGASFDLVPPELLGGRIEHGDVITPLPDKPDSAVGPDRRVAGAPAPLHVPFLEVELGLLCRNRGRPAGQHRSDSEQEHLLHRTPPASESKTVLRYLIHYDTVQGNA